MSAPIAFKLIVGLGNPGSRYNGTRHNFGFALVDWLVENGWGQPIVRAISKWQRRGELEVSELEVEGSKIWVVKPQSFMNCSGEPLKKFLDFHKIKPAQIIVVHDEVDLTLGAIRIKLSGGHGGHNGLRSITEALACADYVRLRLGVGRAPNPNWDLADWVLAKFSAEEAQVAQQSLERGTLALKELILNGVKFAQNQFNC